MEAKAKILIVEDDDNMGYLLKENLKVHGYDTVLRTDGELGWKTYDDEGDFDLCILDVMLPKKDGFNLAKQIKRRNPQVPIIFVTAKSMMQDKVMGFEMGGDDYITKPFSSQELLLRVKAVLKRSKPGAETTPVKNKFSLGQYNFDYLNRSLEFDSKSKRVSAKEADLLRLFCQSPNQLLNRQVILKTVWGEDDYFTSKSMDVYLTRLRKMLREDPNIEIQNVHGIGYKMVVNNEVEEESQK